MKASIAAALLCLCCDFACAQCTVASTGSFPVRGTELIKTASTVPQHDEPVVRAATFSAGSPRQPVIDAPRSGEGDGRLLLLTGLALMLGIVLRRYDTGSR